MLLDLYRKHLKKELENLPDFRYQEIQTHVLTTAILLRKIMERLSMKKKIFISVVERKNNKKRLIELDFYEILSFFIHYETFVPSIMTILKKDIPFTITLESDHSIKKDIAYEIKFEEYFHIAKKFLSNNFILEYLLKKTINELEEMKKNGKPSGTKHEVHLVKECIRLLQNMIILKEIIVPEKNIRYFSYRKPYPSFTIPPKLEKTSEKISYKLIIETFEKTIRFSPFDFENMDFKGKQYFIVNLEVEKLGKHYEFVPLTSEDLLNMLTDIYNGRYC